MVYIFWGDHPFKLRVGVFGNFFWGVRGGEGYLRSPTQERGGGVVKIFRACAIHKKTREPSQICKNNAKNRRSLHNAYYATIKCANYPK